MTKVLIAIQARSGSTRLPRKAFELIGESRMLDHVIDSCKSAIGYLRSRRSVISSIDVAVLTPHGDPIVEAFSGRCRIVEGSEHDVLQRYSWAAADLGPDFIVRITGDCPLIPDYLIAKHITTAVVNAYDYLSNVDEDSRTAIDGHDCEVISRKLLDWLDDEATLPADREHVTLMARREPPPWAKLGVVVHYHDQSAIKLSVDTPADLKAVREAYDARAKKLSYAQRKFGKNAVHRL